MKKTNIYLNKMDKVFLKKLIINKNNFKNEQNFTRLKIKRRNLEKSKNNKNCSVCLSIGVLCV